MSQAQIGSLNVKLGIDTAQFANGVKQAQGTLAGLSNSLKGLAIGAAGAAAGALAGLSIAISRSLTRMDDLGKAAQKIGIPVDQLSKLEYAARLSDVSLESLTTTLARFSRSLSEIGAGGDNDAGAALRAIGVSATDAQGQLRPTAAIIEDVAEQFATMRDGANKTALAIALFGKSGAEMIPLLNGGREAIRGAGEELQRFGGVVTPEAAKQAETFNDNLTRFQTAADGLTQQLVNHLLPAVVDLTEKLLDLFDSGATAQDWFSSLYGWFEGLDPRIRTTRKEIEAIAGVLESIGLIEGGRSLKSDFEGVMPGGKFRATAADAESLLKSVDGKGDAPALPQKENAQRKRQSTLEDIYGTGEAVSALGEAFSTATPEAGLFSDSLLMIGDTIQSGLSSALSGLITGTMSVKEAFTSMAQSIIQSLADIAAELASSALLRMFLGSLGGGGGAGLNIGGMVFGGLFADGGYLGAGKWGIAGEAGPEVIHGPARITPMDKAGGFVNVTVNNYAGAEVRTRQGADGAMQIDILKAEIAKDLARGGNPLSQAVERGYGLRRAGR